MDYRNEACDIFRSVLEDILKCKYKNGKNKILKNKTQSIVGTFPRCGEHYFLASKKVMFVGRAIGNAANPDDIDRLLFNNSTEVDYNRILALFDNNMKDKLDWLKIKDCFNKKNQTPDRHGFFKLAKLIVTKLCVEANEDDWYKYFVWSNVFLLKKENGGNPKGFLYNIQKDKMMKFLALEIDYFKPDCVVFVTGESNYIWLPKEFRSFLADNEIDHIILDRPEPRKGDSKKNIMLKLETYLNCHISL